MSLAELRSRPLVFVDDLAAPVLSEDDHHHLSRSLRVRSGDPLAVSDGRGGWRPATLGSDLEPTDLGPIEHLKQRTNNLTVGFALVKGDRPELVVQKLTEIGVNRIVPLTTERTVVRWDDAKVAKNRQRHRRIAREAAMQSRNLWLPEVWPLTPLMQLVDRFPNAALAEPDAPLLGAGGASPDITTLAIGPEGGFSPAELSDRPLVGLPGNVLRTETAAISAGLMLVLTASRG